MNPLLAYFFSFGATFLAAAVGSAASIEARFFYASLAKPSWAPAAGVFGPVWVLLYIMIATAGGVVMGAHSESQRALVSLFVTQLALNALWSWMFFARESGIGSFVTISALWLTILITTIGFWRVSSVSGALMVPYLAWVTFAAVLNATIWIMNPGAL